jgi:hypothetical protein
MLKISKVRTVIHVTEVTRVERKKLIQHANGVDAFSLPSEKQLIGGS